ncbi:MAG: class I SAM-dependent methyltransferase [Planctomycetota bacterium]|jgi:SAM-dependent methyltransferase
MDADDVGQARDAQRGEPDVRRYRPLERFTNAVENYKRFRPSYPDSLRDALEGLLPKSTGPRVLDLGAGTGISTRWLREGSQATVHGLEPNASMLAAAKAEGGSFVRARAEQLPFQDGSIDLFVGAQCWHWFELDRVLPELRRVGGAEAWSVAFWNVRRVDGSAAGYEALLLEHSTGYQGVTQGRTPLERIARRLGRPLDLERVLAWEDPLDWETLLGRTRSASYVIHEVADRARYEAELRAWFEAEQHGGLVRMPYECVLGGWRVSL